MGLRIQDNMKARQAKIAALPKAQRDEINFAINKGVPHAVTDMLKVSDCSGKMVVIRKIYQENRFTMLSDVLEVAPFGADCMYKILEAYNQGQEEAIPMMINAADQGAERMDYVRRNYV